MTFKPLFPLLLQQSLSVVIFMTGQQCPLPRCGLEAPAVTRALSCDCKITQTIESTHRNDRLVLLLFACADITGKAA